MEMKIPPLCGTRVTTCCVIVDVSVHVSDVCSVHANAGVSVRARVRVRVHFIVTVLDIMIL